jgi:hypothetical protein
MQQGFPKGRRTSSSLAMEEKDKGTSLMGHKNSTDHLQRVPEGIE